MPNLREKMMETVPGSMALFIDDLIYDHDLEDGLKCHSCGKSTHMSWKTKSEFERLGPNAHKVLRAIQHYLERIAHAELEEQAKKEAGWVVELQKRKAEADAAK